MASATQVISVNLFNERQTQSDSKLAFSNPFYTPQSASVGYDAFRRDDELRHSTGSMRGRLHNDKRDVKMKPLLTVASDDQFLPSYRSRCSSDGSDIGNVKKNKKDGFKNSSAQELMGVDGSGSDSHPSVSSLIKGFQSKIDGQGNITPGYLKSGPYHSSYKDLSKSAGASPTSSPTPPEKHRRSGSKRKLSIRRRAKTTVDQADISILEKLGLLPFDSSGEKSTTKVFSHFDVQSLFFDIGNAVVLKNLYEEGSNRQKNISTGASAASIRGQRKRLQAGEGDAALERFRSRTDSVIDDGDTKVNELVASCPYFRNEVGDLEEVSKFPGNKFNKNFEEDFARVVLGFGKNRTPSFEILHTDPSDPDRTYQQVSTLTDLDGVGQVTVLEPIEEDSQFYLWDDPAKEGEKRIFDFEHLDYGALYYRQYFFGKDHSNYFGMDEKFGPVAISLKRDPIEKMAVLGYSLKENGKSTTHKYQYRLLLRTTELQTLRVVVLEDSVPSTSRHGTSRGLPHKDIFEYCLPELQLSCLRQATPGPKVPEQLLKLDEQQLTLQYKVGIMYCKAGQSSEEEMYNNEETGPALQEFLDVIGEKVLLKGFEGYRAQLDNKNDSTGTHSLYAKFHNREVMFHVSTMLPWTGNNKQQLLRKRHIGNDIVTVIFQEPGAVPFSPKNVRSHFQHVFIIVQVENPNTENTTYKVAVTRSMDVPYFGPPIPPSTKFSRNKAFRDFLLTKIINAENAAHKSEKFTAMAVRTRFEYLKDLATNFVTTNSLESGAKFSMFSMSLSGKKKEKVRPNVSPEIWCQGALVWAVKVELEKGSSGYSCHMGISSKTIVFADKSTKEVLFAISCKAVIGWRPSPTFIKLFYNNGQSISFALAGDDEHEMPFVINRLKAVTPGCETQDLTLRRNSVGQLGFHVFYEGLVAEVEPYGMAWHSGLRKGSRLLEISGVIVAGMSHDRMIHMLKKPGAVRVVILPPTPDGQPRHYKALRNLRRYSSMTSLYSINAHNTPESGSLVSSRENVNLENENAGIHGSDSFHNRRNGGFEHPMPLRRESYLASREGIAPNSDLSLDTVEVSSQDRLASISSSTDINHSSEHIRVSLNDIEHKRVASDTSVQIRGSKRTNRPLASTASIHSVDAELTEIERSLADTRKSIDAKFYRSLANSQVPAVRKVDRSNKTGNVAALPEHMSRSFEDIARPPYPDVGEKGDRGSHGRSSTSPRRKSSSRRHSKNDHNSDESTQKNSSAFEDIEASVKTKKGHASRTPNMHQKQPPTNYRSHPPPPPVGDYPRDPSLVSRTAPPRYENIVRNYPPPPSYDTQGSIRSEGHTPRSDVRPSRREEGRTGTRESGEGAYRMLQEKFGSLESRNSDGPLRPPRRRHSSKDGKHRTSSDNSESSSLKNEGRRNGKLVETVLCYSDDKIDKIGSNEAPRRNANLVQTRVRNVSEVLGDHKKSKRKDSPDVVLSLHDSAMTPTSRDAFNREGYYIVTSTTEVPEYEQQYDPRVEQEAVAKNVESSMAQPYSSHLEPHLSKSSEDVSIRRSPSQDRLPYKETTLGPVITTVETYEEREGGDNAQVEGDQLRETFTKLDQAFGFQNQGQAPSSQPVKEDRRRKKRATRRRSRQNVERAMSDSSEEEYADNRRTNSPALRRLANGGSRSNTPNNDKSRPSSSDSCMRNKSEAEESLEAAITEFHKSLSKLPKEHRRYSARSTPEARSSSDTPPGTHTPISPDRVASPVDQGGRVAQPGQFDANVCERAQKSGRKGHHGRFPSDDLGKVRGKAPLSTQEYADRLRKASMDSVLNSSKVRSEAKITLISSPRPWLPRDVNGRPLRRSEEISSGQKYDHSSVKQRQSLSQIAHSGSSKGGNRGNVMVESAFVEPPRNGRLDLDDSRNLSNSGSLSSVREDTRDIITPLPNIPVSPSSVFEDSGMFSLPGRGNKRTSGARKPSLFGMPLTVRALDLAPGKERRLSSSSKQDLEVMLSVLVEELKEEREEKYRLAEELAKTKEEKERLVEQSRAAASQLRKFTSLFFDSVAKKEEVEENLL